MAEYTPKLNLLKKDPVVDGNDTFNIQTMLNDNWDKIDDFARVIEEGLGNVDDVGQAVGELIEQIGNLEELDTETKANLIDAINEIYQDLAAHKAESTAHGTATKAEAQVGTSHGAYMTPLRTKEAIQALESVSSVAGKKGAVTVTKSDVGLSNVLNYGVATQEEAQAGTSNAKYMTPLRTKEAIQALATNGIIKSVQRGRAVFTSTSTNDDEVINITISPVNTSKTMVNLVSFGVYAGSNARMEVALELTSATNLRATNYGGGYNEGVAWEVIEFY